MNFILQTVDNKLEDIDVFNLLQVLGRGGNKHLHSYIFSDSPTILEGNPAFKEGEDYSKYIPVGTIQFVQMFIRHYYSKESMFPIEVPMCLRTEEFLKRSYTIVPTDKLDRDKYSFIKNASILKQFTYLGDTNDVFSILSSLCKYVQSSVLPIESEYRVLVLNGTIRGVRHYDGDCIVFPDIELVKRAVDIVSLDKALPNAYTLDIGVGSFGTCILEMHNFASCGTYGFADSVLPRMYIEGIRYEIEKVDTI